MIFGREENPLTSQYTYPLPPVDIVWQSWHLGFRFPRRPRSRSHRVCAPPIRSRAPGVCGVAGTCLVCVPYSWSWRRTAGFGMRGLSLDRLQKRLTLALRSIRVFRCRIREARRCAAFAAVRSSCDSRDTWVFSGAKHCAARLVSPWEWGFCCLPRCPREGGVRLHKSPLWWAGLLSSPRVLESVRAALVACLRD